MEKRLSLWLEVHSGVIFNPLLLSQSEVSLAQLPVACEGKMLKCQVTGRGIIRVKGGCKWVRLPHVMSEHEGEGGKLSVELWHIFLCLCKGV